MCRMLGNKQRWRGWRHLRLPRRLSANLMSAQVIVKIMLAPGSSRFPPRCDRAARGAVAPTPPAKFGRPPKPAAILDRDDLEDNGPLFGPSGHTVRVARSSRSAWL